MMRRKVSLIYLKLPVCQMLRAALSGVAQGVKMGRAAAQTKIAQWNLQWLWGTDFRREGGVRAAVEGG